jgi:hypothetical protein
LHGCGNQPGGFQELQVLNDSRAGYGQTPLELASAAGRACETLENDHADRETEQREQMKYLPECRGVGVRFSHSSSVRQN